MYGLSKTNNGLLGKLKLFTHCSIDLCLLFLYDEGHLIFSYHMNIPNVNNLF